MQEKVGKRKNGMDRGKEVEEGIFEGDLNVSRDGRSSGTTY